MLAAKELGGSHIEVVDSLTTCSGLYLLIREARKRIREGAKLPTVAKELGELRKRVRMRFSVDDMAPLRRSGRLGNVRMSISTVLNIKPILELKDGAIVSVSLARGRVEQTRRLCAFCEGVEGEIVVNSFLADEAAARLAVQLAGDAREVERRRVGPVLGAHLGAGCLGVCYIER